MSSTKDCSPNDATTQKETSESESDYVGKRNSKKYFIIFGIISIITLVVVFFILFFVLSSSSSPKISSAEALVGNSKDELIFVQILFRHGARAPAHLPVEYEKYFPRGEGMLTDRGYNHSFLMGRFLKKRFVDTGFLNKNMNPKEMEWRARNIERCLSTASTVGAGMFQTETHKYVTVPVITNSDQVENLLNTRSRNCKASIEFYEKTCPKFLERKKNKTEAVYECVGSNHPIFKNISISDSDRYINQIRNDIPVDDYIRENYAIISEEYLKVRNFVNGIGQLKIVQLRFGILVNKLLKDLQKAWKHHRNNETKVKLKVYSTQDWLISGILDAFSVLKYIHSSGPKEEPNYNSMIIMELWKKNGKPYAKLLYKREEVTKEDHEMEDLTHIVPSCDGKECSLKKFEKCCDATRLSSKQKEKLCPSKKPTKG